MQGKEDDAGILTYVKDDDQTFELLRTELLQLFFWNAIVLAMPQIFRQLFVRSSKNNAECYIFQRLIGQIG